MRQMVCALPTRKRLLNGMLADDFLNGRDILCEFPRGRAIIPFWHLSSSVLRKAPKVLSAASDGAKKFLIKILEPIEARDRHKAVVELVVMARIAGSWMQRRLDKRPHSHRSLVVIKIPLLCCV